MWLEAEQGWVWVLADVTVVDAWLGLLGVARGPDYRLFVSQDVVDDVVFLVVDVMPLGRPL